MTNQTAIEVNSISKTFRIPLEGSNGIKQKLINHLKGRRGYREFSPLNDISLTINKGDFFGIVGRNGSGKSTLLKTMAGIYSPNKGNIIINGKLVPFIELGVGFNPELSGRDNVFLNGALLGFSRKEMEEMYDDIVEFAELHDFMEERLKNYSSGMQVRLAFSIAIKAESDTLLLDEVLAVGDEAFQRKCYAYFEDLKRDKKTVILVTHDMGAVERFCNKAMLIESGKIVEIGNPKVVAHAYKRLFSPKQDAKQETQIVKNKRRWGTNELLVTKVSPKKVNESDKKVYIDISIKQSKKINEKVILAYTIKSKDRRSLFGDGGLISISKSAQDTKYIYRLSFDNILSNGDYFLDLSLRKDGSEEYMDFWIDATSFSVESTRENGLNIVPNTELEQL